MRFENRDTSERPEIEFTASVRTKELHFEEVPTPQVRFPGHSERKSDWLSERDKLPDEVQEGVVYHDAGVRLLIASEAVDRRKDRGKPGASKDKDGVTRDTSTEENE